MLVPRHLAPLLAGPLRDRGSQRERYRSRHQLDPDAGLAPVAPSSLRVGRSQGRMEPLRGGGVRWTGRFRRPSLSPTEIRFRQQRVGGGAGATQSSACPRVHRFSGVGLRRRRWPRPCCDANRLSRQPCGPGPPSWLCPGVDPRRLRSRPLRGGSVRAVKGRPSGRDVTIRTLDGSGHRGQDT